MKFSNIDLGKNVEIDPSTSINNVVICDDVKIAKRCSIYGSPEFQLHIGKGTYIGMNAILNGFSEQLHIGQYVSIAQNVNIMVDSGPNACERMQKIFPIVKGAVSIGDHTWIGASVVIMPNVKIGKYSVIAANSFVKDSFPDFSIVGGSPASLIRSLSQNERDMLLSQ